MLPCNLEDGAGRASLIPAAYRFGRHEALSVAKKMVHGCEKMFSVGEKLVSVAEKMVSVVEKIFSVAEKIFFDDKDNGLSH